jgi:hypothetical protein
MTLLNTTLITVNIAGRLSQFTNKAGRYIDLELSFRKNFLDMFIFN